MIKYRHRLPQLSEEVFLTDGGIETTLIFHEGFDLPHFAAFHLLRNEGGRGSGATSGPTPLHFAEGWDSMASLLRSSTAHELR